jgi:large subunit ribosomal protein L23Ae
MDAYDIVKYPLSTEKAVREMEASNSLIFVVAKSAKKEQIKKAVELAFNVKVKNVRTLVGPDSKKKAYVRLSEDTPAIDVTTQLGLV